jgi:hypothetical protein
MRFLGSWLFFIRFIHKFNDWYIDVNNVDLKVMFELKKNLTKRPSLKCIHF